MNCSPHGGMTHNLKDVSPIARAMAMAMDREILEHGNGLGNIGASTSSATQRQVMEMSDEAKRLMAQFRDDITDAIWADYVACGQLTCHVVAL